MAERPSPANMKYKPIDPSSDLDMNAVAENYEAFQELAKSDSSQTTGLLYEDDYAQILKNYLTPEQAATQKQAALKMSQNNFVEFARNNSGGLVDLVNASPEDLYKIATSQEHYGEKNPDYNAIAEQIQQTKKEHQVAREDTTRYFEEYVLDGCCEFQKHLALANADAHIQAYLEGAEVAQREAIEGYNEGTTSFVKDLVKAREEQAKPQREEIGKLEQEMRGKLENAEDEGEKQNIIEEYNGKITEVREDEQYQNAIQEEPMLLFTLLGTAYQIHKAKQKESDNNESDDQDNN